MYAGMERHLPYALAVELREMGELMGDAGGNKVEGNSDEVESAHFNDRNFQCIS